MRPTVYGIMIFLQLSFISWGITLAAIVRKTVGEDAWYRYHRFSRYMREYGFALFLLPIIWVGVVMYVKSSKAPKIEEEAAFWGGVILTIVLFFSALFSFS